MAIVQKQILGEISGTLGDIIYRKRYGKTVIYARAGKHSTSNSKAAKAGRKSFALSVAFAKSVNSISELKQIWQLAKLEGVVAYNRIIKYNKDFIANDRFTVKNIITPGGVPLNITNIELLDHNLRLKINVFENLSKKLFQDSFTLSCVLYIYNPTGASINPFEITTNTKIIETISNEDIMEIEIQLDAQSQQILGNYKNAIIYLAVSKYNGNKKKIFWTNTFAKELELA